MANPFAYLTADHFLDRMQKLLPPGSAFLANNPVMKASLGAGADLQAKFHADLATLTEVEADPHQTALLLDLWEKDYGLPDPCMAQPQTLDQRRAALVARIADQGGLSRQKHINLAKSAGYDVTIDEFDVFKCGSTCESPVYGEDWAYAYRVNAPAVTVREFTCESSCEEPLRNWGNDQLECVMTRAARADATVIFAYAD